MFLLNIDTFNCLADDDVFNFSTALLAIKTPSWRTAVVWWRAGFEADVVSLTTHQATKDFNTWTRLFLAHLSLCFGCWTLKQTDCHKSRTHCLLIYSAATDSLNYLYGLYNVTHLLVSESFLFAICPDKGMFPDSGGAVQILENVSIFTYCLQLKTSGTVLWRVPIRLYPNKNEKNGF